jgi:hypothetical protein
VCNHSWHNFAGKEGMQVTSGGKVLPNCYSTSLISSSSLRAFSNLLRVRSAF